MKTPEFKIEDGFYDELSSMTEELINKSNHNEDRFFEMVLRVYAKPPVKGEITEGKIRWRGIRLCTQVTEFGNTKWLEQRGDIIGPKLKKTFVIK